MKRQANAIILVIDNSILRKNLANSLKASGFEIFSVEDARNGFSLAQSENPKIVITNLVPLVKKIRDENMEIPIIFLYSKPEEEKHAATIGANYTLPIEEPFDHERLYKNIKAFEALSDERFKN